MPPIAAQGAGGAVIRSEGPTGAGSPERGAATGRGRRRDAAQAGSEGDHVIEVRTLKMDLPPSGPQQRAFVLELGDDA